MAQYNVGFSTTAEVPPPEYNENKNIHGNKVEPSVMYGPPPAMQVTYGQPMGQPVLQDGFAPPNAQQMPATYWMERPNIQGCPPGLEYLTQIDQLLVKQRIELFEVLTGFETNNRYDVKNIFGQTIYVAKEDTHCLSRYFCGPNRPFTIHILDNANQEVIQIKRDYKCHLIGHCLSCAECCQDRITVESPPGVVVGYVQQIYEGCNVRYIIMNEQDDVVLRIHGPSYCHCYCPGDEYPLSLMSSNGEIEVGKISKQWSNLIQEYFTDADNFGIQFPIDLDIKIKAVVLGAVFLIDFMFFETNQQSHN